MIQDLIWRRFGVEYNPHYRSTLLKNMGFLPRKPVLSRIISMKPNASNGVGLDGPRFYVKHGRKRPYYFLAMRPVLPSGAR
jgi:hypothetical protein